MALSASEEKTIVSLFTRLKNIDPTYYCAAFYFVSGFLRSLTLNLKHFDGIDLPPRKENGTMGRIVGMIAIMLLATGCASLKVERTVKNNVFYSERDPKALIEVDPKLQYLGKFEKKATAKDRHQVQKGYPSEITSFVF
ncbi:MAG: hypothetical protein PHS17_16440, partial [Desulfobacterales bacterium]|nr:hypothetical protein [Desulfobacterales bacterium]